jgi:RNA polymerase sigma factor (sigma-70 family)
MLAAAQQGAGWACTRLYETLSPAVFGFLRAQGARDPADLTSEVFLAVFSRCGSFSGNEAQFRSWVFTIAHHRLVDERRAAARRPPPEPLDDAPAARTPVSAAAEDVAIQRLGVERVTELLGVLTDDQRAVLTLRVIAGMTVDEVASTLGKPPGAVKALQHRGLESLRRTLAAKGAAR